jgi:hypothetical protein
VALDFVKSINALAAGYPDFSEENRGLRKKWREMPFGSLGIALFSRVFASDPDF